MLSYYQTKNVWQILIGFAIWTHTLTWLFVPTEAPSFVEPEDTIMEKVVNSKVVIPCHAKGMKWFINENK